MYLYGADQLRCYCAAFGFAYTKSRLSRDAAHFKRSLLDLDTIPIHNMSLVMRKQAFCICENKDANQLRGPREADQRLCFRY